MSEFKFVKKLGAGAFGTVSMFETPSNKSYARDHRYVAIKCIEGASENAKKEAELLKQFTHRHIIPCLDVFSSGGKLHIVMEYGDEGTLSNYIDGKSFPEKEVWAFARQISSAITYFHGKSIIHRDLKPANIIAVSFPGNVICLKIADFGIARVLDEVTGGSTGYARTQIGTAMYMSPEALNGERYGKPTDIWSFGAVISAFCNKGNHLFTSRSTVLNWTGGKSSLPSHYNIELRQLTANMMHPEPSNRPAASAVYHQAGEESAN